MKILLTGATGFIGSRLALKAQADGNPVVALGQTNTPPEQLRAAELQRAGVRVQTGSLLDEAYLKQVTAGCDTVIHLAAAQHESNVPEKYFFDVNVDGTRKLMDACLASGVRRFLYGSTIGVYGEAAGRVLTETSPPNPMNHYGRSKLAAEQLVLEYGARLPVSVVRISETYGPGDFRLLKLFKAVDRGRFVIIGDGQNRRQMIHVADLIRGLLLAASAPAALGQVFVMAGREVLTTNETVAQVAAVLDKKPPGVRVPMWPVLTLATLMEKTMTPLGLSPPLHRRRLDFFRKSFLFDIAKGRTVLGFEPQVSFRDGARETAAWYRAQGLL